MAVFHARSVLVPPFGDFFTTGAPSAALGFAFAGDFAFFATFTVTNGSLLWAAWTIDVARSACAPAQRSSKNTHC